jgi:hypothetical protein
MAVPSSGTLSLWGLAKEKTHDNYASGIPIALWKQYFFDDVSLRESTTGAGDYDGTNQDSTNKPDGIFPYGMAEWYGYDHDATVVGGPTGKCLVIVDHDFVTPGTQTGCDSSNAVVANTGIITTGGNPDFTYDRTRWARYKNSSANTVNYRIRVGRDSTASGSPYFKIYKGSNANSGGNFSGYTLTHTHTNYYYQVFTGTLTSGEELYLHFGYTSGTTSGYEYTTAAVIDQFYVTGSCDYNGTMYAVPLLGSGSSTAYQWSSAQSAWSNGYSQRYNSSSWSTAYIHQCAGSAWTIGNTIYQTNSNVGSEVAFGGTGWRCGAYPTSTFSSYGYPGGNQYTIVAFYNAYHATGNIENTYSDPIQ